MVFQAISFNQSQCGKTVKQSKKKFTWIFRVNKQTHTIQLIASFLTGKRRVFHNSEEVYSQKQILNVDFQFIRNIENHLLKIKQDNRKFDLLVDNIAFSVLLYNKNSIGLTDFSDQIKKKQKKQIQSDKNQIDPFAFFNSIPKNSLNKPVNNPFNQSDFTQKSYKINQAQGKYQASQPNPFFTFDQEKEKPKQQQKQINSNLSGNIFGEFDFGNNNFPNKISTNNVYVQNNNNNFQSKPVYTSNPFFDIPQQKVINVSINNNKAKNEDLLDLL